MTDNILHVPFLGEGIEDAEIVLWHVSAGDHVVAGQPLVSVETSNAMLEIPAPRSGRIATCLAGVGDRLHTGDLLLEFATASEDHGAVVGELPDEEHNP
jgi:2-oxoisovalerate dehydrogenase E2 component (dihydrolipoyl transacylase)